jgi:signal peptidase I
MSDDGAAWRERIRGAQMNGDGFGAPPWGPADPVPELEDTQVIPGLGAASAPGEPSSRSQAGGSRRDDTYGHAFQPAGAGGPGANGAGAGSSGAGGPGGGAGTKQDSPADPAGDTDASGGKSGKRRRSFWRELPVLIVVALVLALLIKTFAVQAFYIPSGSMQNTLEIGDRVLINKVVYHLRPIHRGDIVVFDGTGSWNSDSPAGSSNIFSKAVDELEGLVGISQDPNIYIKRVIGLPGDHVVCCNTAGQVTVNGVALSESSYLYPGNAPSTQKFNITVPPGRLWVMGDHRAISYDSRGHMGDPGGGTIPESGVLGRAFVIIWPPSQWGPLNIPATFEQPQLNAGAAAGGNAAAGGSSAALEAALDNGTPVRQTASPLPLALGFVGAVPITWLQRKASTRRRARRSKAQEH